MKKIEKVFTVIKNEGLLEILSQAIYSELYDDDSSISFEEMISEYTDADRFAGWLEADAEEFDITFEQLEAVWEQYSKEIIDELI